MQSDVSSLACVGPCCPAQLFESTITDSQFLGTNLQFQLSHRTRIRPACYASLLLSAPLWGHGEPPHAQAWGAQFSLNRLLSTAAATELRVAEAGSTGATSAQTPMLSVIHQTHQGEDSGAMESESESEEGGEDGSNGGDGGGSSDDGSEEEGGQRRDNWSEMGENTEEELSRVMCGLCRRGLVPKRTQPHTAGSTDPLRIRICDGCHQAYHTVCCRRRGVGVRKQSPWARQSDWFCSSGCEHAHTTLAYRCKEGPLDLPQGALPPHDSHPLTDDPTHDSRPTGAPTWQLACSEGRRHAAQREALLNVSAVMLEHYGPFVRREVESSDYGALLLRDGAPVAAATLDCFGADVCVIDKLATVKDAQRQGNARALVSSLEVFLGVNGAARRLVAVVDDDEGARGAKPRTGGRRHGGAVRMQQSGVMHRGLSGLGQGGSDGKEEEDGAGAKALWSRRMGYKAMTKREVKALASQYATLGLYPDSKVFYSKPLAQPVVDVQQASCGMGITVAEADDVLASLDATKQDEALKGSMRQHSRQPRKSHFRLRLWAWAARKLLNTATFGLL